MTDIVSIRDLSVAAVIGAYEAERDIVQTLLVSVDMAADVGKAARSDELADALDYAKVAETIRAVIRDGKFRLIETAAERVAERLMADHHGVGCTVVQGTSRCHASALPRPSPSNAASSGR